MESTVRTVWLMIAVLTAPLQAQTVPDKITLSTISISMNYLPIYIAQEKGFFTKEIFSSKPSC